MVVVERPRPRGRLVVSRSDGVVVGAPLGELQRARMVGAMFDVVAEHGAAAVTVAGVVERSGVSRRTFYEQFADRDECFIVAFEQAVARAGERVLPAYWGEGVWRERIRAALVALLGFLEEWPTVGRLLLAEPPAGSRVALDRRRELIGALTRAIDEGRGEARAGDPPPLTAEGLVGGVLSVIQSRLVARQRGDGDSGGSLFELAGGLASMIVLPYLGPSAARRELGRTVQQRPAPVWRVAVGDPFKAAGMRLTYRTVRVLVAVGEREGASNREIGHAAEIADQGQTSKLLARLRRIGLIANTGVGPAAGVPNAWSLTDSGRRMIDAVHAHIAAGAQIDGGIAREDLQQQEGSR